MANISTDLVVSLLIPEATFSVEVQTAILKRTLSCLDTLPVSVKASASIGMQKYMQSVDSHENPLLMQSILEGLTETEAEGLLSLVKYVKPPSKKAASKKSTIPSDYFDIIESVRNSDKLKWQEEYLKETGKVKF